MKSIITALFCSISLMTMAQKTIAVDTSSKPNLRQFQNKVTPLSPYEREHRSFNDNGTIVNFYENNLLAGKRWSVDMLGKTELSFPTLSADWNDVISSLLLPKNYKVVLYKHANFQGEQRIILGLKQIEHSDKPVWTGTVNFANTEWNDRVSSIKIIRL